MAGPERRGHSRPVRETVGVVDETLTISVPALGADRDDGRIGRRSRKDEETSEPFVCLDGCSVSVV